MARGYLEPELRALIEARLVERYGRCDAVPNDDEARAIIRAAAKEHLANRMLRPPEVRVDVRVDAGDGIIRITGGSVELRRPRRRRKVRAGGARVVDLAAWRAARGR